MQEAGGIDARLETKNGCVPFSIRAPSGAPGPFRAEFATHDDVAVLWKASVPCTYSDELDTWSGQLSDNPDELPTIVELTHLTDALGRTANSSSGLAIFQKPLSSGEWMSGGDAASEWLAVFKARHERYNVMLNQENSLPADDIFYVLLLAENLLIGSPQHVPGISVAPLQNSTFGQDAAKVLSDVMSQRSFSLVLDIDQWLDDVRQRNPAVIVDIPRIRASTWEKAASFAVSNAQNLLTLLSIRRHTAAKLTAGVIGRVHTTGGVEYIGKWVGQPIYSGNLMTGLISGEDPHSLQELWSGMQRNKQAQLWTSLLTDAIRESRWDYRLFRCFNLLEGIAKEKLGQTAVVTDSVGAPIERSRKKDGTIIPYTTAQAQGAVYSIIQTALLPNAESARNYIPDYPTHWDWSPSALDLLWEEVGAWTEIRNDVSHSGSWQTNPHSEGARHRKTRELLASRSLSGQGVPGEEITLRPLKEAAIQVVSAAIVSAF